MSKVHKRGATSVEMNMTPLIDVTFQLIIFFMLVNNIIAEEVVELIPPELDNPRVIELGDVKKVTVNVAPVPFNRAERTGGDAKPLNHPSNATEVRIGSAFQCDPGDAEAIVAELKKYKESFPEIEVMLRADCAIAYEEIQPVLGAITGAGISKVNLVAYLEGKGPSADPEVPVQ